MLAIFNLLGTRLIGTLRRDCLDHVLIFGERHLRQVPTVYSRYYNDTRTHLGLRKDAPLGRAVQRSAPSYRSRSYPGCIIATRGCDFREGQHRNLQESRRLKQAPALERGIGRLCGERTGRMELVPGWSDDVMDGLAYGRMALGDWWSASFLDGWLAKSCEAPGLALLSIQSGCPWSMSSATCQAVNRQTTRVDEKVMRAAAGGRQMPNIK